MIDFDKLTPEEQQELVIALQAALDAIQQPPVDLEYRAYYDEAGKIITYTTENKQGNYVVVTKDQYEQARHDAIVVSNTLIFTHIKNNVVKLIRDRNNITDYRASKYDASVVADEDDLEIHYYAQRVYEIIR